MYYQFIMQTKFKKPNWLISKNKTQHSNGKYLWYICLVLLFTCLSITGKNNHYLRKLKYLTILKWRGKTLLQCK